jgi:hypothetical protein
MRPWIDVGITLANGNSPLVYLQHRFIPLYSPPLSSPPKQAHLPIHQDIPSMLLPFSSDPVSTSRCYILQTPVVLEKSPLQGPESCELG